MIKLFRKVRQTLINEGKTSKYLKYAIGEIVLVVIGILIALQINNWNENRKLAKTELKVLHEIQSNLKQSLWSINQGLTSSKLEETGFRALLEHIEAKKPYKPELDTIFFKIPYWYTPFFTYAAYESLKLKGADLIQNDSLRISIIALHEQILHYLKDDYDAMEWRDSEAIVMPYFSKHFARSVDGEFSAKPDNYEALLEDPEFTNLLRILILNRSSGNSAFKHISEYVEKTIKEIDKELDARGFVRPDYKGEVPG